MKKVLGPFIVLCLFAACQAPQKKQYFTASPEIDMVKSLDQAIQNADWDTFRAAFHDTATIWFNDDWANAPITADSLVTQLKAVRGNMTEMKLGENVIYEMVETEQGQHWVHRWGAWTATMQNGKTAKWLGNANFDIAGGKVIAAGYVSNGLPLYLANQPDPAPSAK